MSFCSYLLLSSPLGMWHVSVDSGWGYRLFSSACSLLGDVCFHFVLDSYSLPVYNLPYWSTQQDITGPLDHTGNSQTHANKISFSQSALTKCSEQCMSVIHCLYFFQSLCTNCSATVLYLVAAVAGALCVNLDVRGRHNYNCWAASAVRTSIFIDGQKC